MVYTIEFAESVKAQMRALTARQRATIIGSIEKQLVHEPLVETRNKKQLRPNPVAPWELRRGDLRVFYEVALDDPDTVRILAVGQKRENRLYIAGKEIEI